MSLTNGLSRAPSHVFNSRAALSRLPIPASTGPVAVVAATKRAIPDITSTTPPPIRKRQGRTPIWFNATESRCDVQSSWGPENPRGSDEDGRKVKLGKTLRIIQERLPSLLQSPLPQEILSPNISLHLFPSTHPYLPTVSGKVAYIAALWSSPIAWNRVPIIGNVQLEILSERMTNQPLYFSPRRTGAYGEQLIVKWRTAEGKSTKNSDSSPTQNGNYFSTDHLSLTEQGEQKLDDKLRGTLNSSANGTNGDPVSGKKPFTGLFIFEFDKDGRVISHTIEHVDEYGDWEKGVGARVVGLTDWLLGGIKGRTEGGVLPAFEDYGKGRRP